MWTPIFWLLSIVITESLTDTSISLFVQQLQTYLAVSPEIIEEASWLLGKVEITLPEPLRCWKNLVAKSLFSLKWGTPCSRPDEDLGWPHGCSFTYIQESCSARGSRPKDTFQSLQQGVSPYLVWSQLRSELLNDVPHIVNLWSYW